MCNQCGPGTQPSPWAPTPKAYFLVMQENGSVTYNGIVHRKFVTQAEAEVYVIEQIKKFPTAKYLIVRTVERLTGSFNANHEFFA